MEEQIQDLFKPSKDQEIFIRSPKDQNQKIIACAGSGKSTTLIYRIKHLIEIENINPKQIMLTAFNVYAADSLRQKLQQVLGKVANEIKTQNIDKFIIEIYTTKVIYSNSQKIKCLLDNFKKNIKQNLTHISMLVHEYLEDQKEDSIFSEFQYFFFDEFQDISEIQYKIFMLFLKNGCKLIAMGDPNQSIYSFRGSQIEFILSDFEANIKQAKQKFATYNLSTNFRCKNGIIKFCNRILSKLELTSSMVGSQISQNEDKPKVFIHKNTEDQYKSIIDDILKKREQQQYAWNEIAILSPLNIVLDQLEEYMNRNKQMQKQELFSQNEKEFKAESQKQKAIYPEEIPFIRLQKKNDSIHIPGQDQNNEESKNCITLSTLHLSKGLEWKVVYIIGINDKQFPESFIKKKCYANQEKLSKEYMRLFYVACTRAKDLLYFSFLSEYQQFICRFFEKMSSYTDGLNEFQIKIKDKLQPPPPYLKENDCDNTLRYIASDLSKEDYEKANFFINLLECEHNEGQKRSVTFNISQLTENRLYEDLYSYVDLLMKRCIAQALELEEGYQCKAADEIFYTIGWDQNKKGFIKKHLKFFEPKTLNFDAIQNIYQFKKKFTAFSQKVTEKKDIELLEKIFDDIRKFLRKNNIKYINVNHFSKLKKQFTEKFQSDELQLFKKYYEQFTNKANQICGESESHATDQQHKNANCIYQVNKLNLLSKGVSKSFYMDDDKIIKLLHPHNLKFNITRFTSSLQKQKNDQFNKLKNDNNNKKKGNNVNEEQLKSLFKMKKVVEYKVLKGVADLLCQDKLYSFIYTIPSQQRFSIQFEDILEVLAQALILTEQGINVNKIIFFNVLQEEEIKYDLKNIDQQKRKDILEFFNDKVQKYLTKQNQSYETGLSNQQNQISIEQKQVRDNQQIQIVIQQQNNDEPLIQQIQQLYNEQPTMPLCFQKQHIQSSDQNNQKIQLLEQNTMKYLNNFQEEITLNSYDQKNTQGSYENHQNRMLDDTKNKNESNQKNKIYDLQTFLKIQQEAQDLAIQQLKLDQPQTKLVTDFREKMKEIEIQQIKQQYYELIEEEFIQLVKSQDFQKLEQYLYYLKQLQSESFTEHEFLLFKVELASLIQNQQKDHQTQSKKHNNQSIPINRKTKLDEREHKECSKEEPQQKKVKVF